MEYSKENIMSRKEYLKNKDKNKKGFNLKPFKYILLVIVVVLLGIYLFKQLNIYNNVTKIANKVVEETALAKTMKMYFVSEPYSKDDISSVMIYKASDESRIKINGSEGFYNIKVIDNKLYGLANNKLYKIDLITNNKQLVLEQDVSEYFIKDDKIYFYSYFKDTKKTGIYLYDINKNQTKLIISGIIYQMLLDNNNIYIVANGKTNKSILRYNLNGENKQILTGKNIVAKMIYGNNNIYFINSSDKDKIYSVSKNGSNLKKVSNNAVCIDNLLDYEYSANSAMDVYKNYLYYINNNDNNTLYSLNLKSGKETVVVKKNIESIQIKGNNIYYKVKNSIGINKYNLLNGEKEQVTSARTKQYICIN